MKDLPDHFSKSVAVLRLTTKDDCSLQDYFYVLCLNL